jgi:hypothetical protein
VTSRAGSHAGRGFRYQDAVAASLALLGWAGQSPYGFVIPEGDDDIELGTTAGRVLGQVKSRREKRGLFPMPVVKGMHVPMCAVGGADRLFPAEERAREWIEQVGLLPMPEAATSMWSTFCEAAMDFAVFAAQGLGLDDRPVLERTSKADVVARLVASKAGVDKTLPPLLREMTNTLVALAVQQPEELLESQLGLLRQELTPVAEVLLDAQYACYSVDLGMAPAYAWVESTSQGDGAQQSSEPANS